MWQIGKVKSLLSKEIWKGGRLHLFHCQSRGFTGRRRRSKSQALKSSSCCLHLLHLVPQGPAQWLQQFSANAEMMKCTQGWISRSCFGWWEHTQLMPTSRFDDRLLWWNVNQHICFCNICKSIQQVSSLLTWHFQHPMQIENGYINKNWAQDNMIHSLNFYIVINWHLLVIDLIYFNILGYYPSFL